MPGNSNFGALFSFALCSLGFKIADLAKLKSLKSIEGNGVVCDTIECAMSFLPQASLLDYLVDFILVQNPQYAAFTEDLGIVHQAKGTAKQGAHWFFFSVGICIKKIMLVLFLNRA